MQRSRIFLLLLCLAPLSLLQAQDVYEFTYRFPGDSGKTVYSGLVFRNSDNNGFIRMSALNKKTGKRVLYDFSITLNEYDLEKQQEGGLKLTDEDSTDYWYCWSENYKIKEGAELYDFDYLRFWFKRKKGSRVIEPCSSTPFEVKGRYLGFLEEPESGKIPAETDSLGNPIQPYQATGILSFKPHQGALFSKTFLSAYFIPGELFREGTYTKKQVLACRNNIRSVMHLVNVINSRDEDISVNCVEDGKAVSSYFSDIATFLELRFTEKKLTGAQFSISAVRAAIGNLRPGKDDIVIFYYSGHGFRWKGDTEYPFPQMGLYYGTPPSWNHMGAFSMNIEDIYKAIQRKGARLNLVLGDCCNTIVNRRRSEIKDTTDIAMQPGLKYMNMRTATALFLQTRASVLVAAAEKGQPANCSRVYNGFFTNSLLKTFTEFLFKPVPDPNWPDIIRATENKTYNLALQYGFTQNIIYKYCPAGSGNACRQYLGQKTGAAR